MLNSWFSLNAEDGNLSAHCIHWAMIRLALFYSWIPKSDRPFGAFIIWDKVLSNLENAKNENMNTCTFRTVGTILGFFLAWDVITFTNETPDTVAFYGHFKVVFLNNHARCEKSIWCRPQTVGKCMKKYIIILERWTRITIRKQTQHDLTIILRLGSSTVWVKLPLLLTTFLLLEQSSWTSKDL